MSNGNHEGKTMNQAKVNETSAHRSEVMEHTPGPWHWDSDPVKGDPLERRRYRVTALGRTITQIYYTSELSGQAEIDAKLIAAAPALLESLRAILGWRELREGANEIPIERIEGIARSAIALVSSAVSSPKE